jgi:hypothetical protein
MAARKRKKTLRPKRKLRYEIRQERLGPSAVLFDARGRSINVINGHPGDTEAVRRAAKRHWPDAVER